MVYQILFLLLIFVGYWFYSGHSNPNSPDNRRGFIIYVCVVFIIQSALRNLAVGSDTFQYYNLFQSVKASSWAELFDKFELVYIYGEGKDPGYAIIEKIFQLLIPNFRCWLFAVAIFFFYTWGKLVYHYTSSLRDIIIAVSVYLLLFYSFFSITGLRQTIAVALSIHCFMALKDKKYIAFVLMGIVAFTIHRSAMIILFFPILNRVKNIRLIFFICTLLLILFATNRQYFVDVTLESGGYDTGYQIRLPYTLMVFYALITLWFYVAVKKQRDSNQIFKTIFFFYLPTYCWIPLMGWDSPFMRESLFFSIYATILMPISIKDMKNNSNLIFIGFILFSCSYFLLNSSDYGFFWDTMYLGENYGGGFIPFEQQIQ